MILCFTSQILTYPQGSKDIKPGGSLTVYEAFELSSMDPVEVEVYEWLSWDDTPILNSTVEIE